MDTTKGYPVISVEVKDQKLEFDQTQFYLSGSQGNGQWIVPIIYYVVAPMMHARASCYEISLKLLTQRKFWVAPLQRQDRVG
ncbi:hypothetical protein ACFX1R_018266 [Malus domestica]